MRYLFGLIFLISIFAAFPVHCAEQFGIQIYGGARPDKEETDFLKQAGADSYCYRTTDSLQNVMVFYQKHPGLASLGRTETAGMFMKEDSGRTFYIKIESPWQPSRGGPRNTDTIIVITRE